MGIVCKRITSVSCHLTKKPIRDKGLIISYRWIPKNYFFIADQFLDIYNEQKFYPRSGCGGVSSSRFFPQSWTLVSLVITRRSLLAGFIPVLNWRIVREVQFWETWNPTCRALAPLRMSRNPQKTKYRDKTQKAEDKRQKVQGVFLVVPP